MDTDGDHDASFVLLQLCITPDVDFGICIMPISESEMAQETFVVPLHDGGSKLHATETKGSNS